MAQSAAVRPVVIFAASTALLSSTSTPRLQIERESFDRRSAVVAKTKDDTENIMKKNDPAIFHKLYGIKKTKIRYYGRDFLGYLLMILLSALVVSFSYGFGHVMSIVGLALC